MYTAKSTQFIFTLVLICAFCAHSFAADLIVEENAVAPNYASIQAAVNDASPGDRIFIKNKGQNIPWLETVTVDRPVSLLPLDPVAGWLFTGDINVTPDDAQFSTTNDEIVILGAIIFSGNIAASGHAYTDFIKVSVVSCRLDAGNITLAGGNNQSQWRYKTNVSGNLLNNGDVKIGYGNVIANQINGDIWVEDIGWSTPDTTWLVGNRLINSANSPLVGRIYWRSDQNYAYVANNYIRYNAYSGICIEFWNFRKGAPGGHTIVNNTIESIGTQFTRGISFSSITSETQIRIENNVFYDSNTGEGFQSQEFAVLFSSVASDAVVIVNYNTHINWGGGLTNTTPLGVYPLGNTLSTTLADADIDDVSGDCTHSDCDNVGSPDNRHTDLDLSQNDRGTAGGSFNYSNFWPILDGGARVFLVKTPRTVIQGSTIDAEAIGYDR